MNGFRAVVLDFDGLILDTESPALETWSEIYREHGCELDRSRWLIGVGTVGGFDPMAHLESLLSRGLDRTALSEIARERHRGRCRVQPLLPGARELIDAARRLGLRTGVASSSTFHWVGGWLEQHGLLQGIDAVCTRDDVGGRPKPAPDVYLAVAGRLGVPPGSCVAFEDSPNGVRAARAAGFRCVAVPNGVTRGLPLEEADLVLGSLAERPLPGLLADLAGLPPQPLAADRREPGRDATPPGGRS